MDRSELMKQPKEDLADGVTRLKNRLRKMKDAAAQGAERAMGVALAGGGAFAVGYYVGGIKADIAAGTATEEDLKMWGMDRDLLAGIVIGGLGLTGLAGKKASPYFLHAGTGVLSYWAGNMGEQMAIENAMPDTAG